MAVLLPLAAATACPQPEGTAVDSAPDSSTTNEPPGVTVADSSDTATP